MYSSKGSKKESIIQVAESESENEEICTGKNDDILGTITDRKEFHTTQVPLKQKDFYLIIFLCILYYNKTLLCLYIAPMNLKMATIVFFFINFFFGVGECKLG